VRSPETERFGSAFIGLGDLHLEEYLGVGSFDAVRDQVTQIRDNAYVTITSLGWQPSGRASQSFAAIEARRVPIFVRRMGFEWGTVLVLDDPSPERRLLLSTIGTPEGGFAPDVGQQPVVSIGFIGNRASTFSLIRTHCLTKDGCSSKLGGCKCDMREVVTDDGDDAWACLCDKHGSA